MCPTGLGMLTRSKGFMDYDLFTQITDEMAPHVQTTTLHIWGEPLLHPQIHDMIAYCGSRGLYSEISTNATVLNEESSRKILDAGLGSIYLCLDGATQETYERVRRRADFEQTRENIRRTAEELQNQQVSQAAASGTRAQRELDELKNEFRRKTADRFTEEMKELRDLMDEVVLVFVQVAVRVDHSPYQLHHPRRLTISRRQ